jgi:hypothetical protein
LLEGRRTSKQGVENIVCPSESLQVTIGARDRQRGSVERWTLSRRMRRGQLGGAGMEQAVGTGEDTRCVYLGIKNKGRGITSVRCGSRSGQSGGDTSAGTF